MTKEFEFILRVWKTTKKNYSRKDYYNWYRSIIYKINNKYNDDDDDEINNDLTNVEYLHLKLNNCESEPYFYDYVSHFLIFIDDASHSKIYRKSDSNPFINFFLRHRHYNCSMICAAQTFKNGITRDLRLNMSCWCIFKQSEEDMKKIYDEVISSTIRNRYLFYKLFEEITDKDHDFIMIDKESKNKNLMIRKNFDQILELDELDKIFKSSNYINGEKSENTQKDSTKEKKENFEECKECEECKEKK